MRALYENYFDLIFHLNPTIAELFWHAEHYGRDFDMIFHLKLETAQNLVGQQHERDFHMIFHFKKSKKISCRAQGNFDMNFLFMAPQILITEQYERDFDMIFHVKAAQTSLQSAME